MSTYIHMMGKPSVSVVSNGIFCGDFPSQSNIGNNVSELAGKPLRLSLKDKTDSKLLLKSNLKTNLENICWPFDSLYFSVHPSQPTFPAYSTASTAPLSSFLTISHSLSLPIWLSIGGALEKVVHFWISGFFEVEPSLLLVCNLSFLSLISPLICLPLFLSSPPAPLLSLPNFASLPTLVLFPSPLLSSLSLWSMKFPSISTLALRVFTLAWLDSDSGLLHVLLNVILKQLQVLD